MNTTRNRRLKYLIEALESFQNQSQQVYCVVATNLIDTNNFYVVPITCYNHCEVLERPGSPCEVVKMNSLVIYLSPRLGHFVRGTVIRMDGNMNIIFAIDYGIAEIVPVTPNNILYNPQNNEAGLIPPLAHLCQLTHCDPQNGTFTDDEIITFRRFMGPIGDRLQLLIKEKTNNKLVVRVISGVTMPDCVSTILSICHLTTYFSLKKG